MKVILEGKAQSQPEAVSLITEEMLINPDLANEKLNPLNIRIDKVEFVNGEKVVYLADADEHLLLG